ncbi:hypothetical protein CKM354_001262400 [Cercospora kikuchii]|uniref:Methyltransferase domain-containing protein n=1 Tax=Cercospora kikuchii TaxID=84275 RepID=A0A9P3FMF6_9PEZI|nr:uncharacterized protein CKM354_001262400 [Cercospora kikuchii]GIZ49594.1 hypothetical protein CKM354_001262400 [Cercospora kikuchii]
MEKSPYGLAANRSSDTDFRATPQDLYNDLGKAYEDAYNHNEAQIRSLQWLLTTLPPTSQILDLGCGTGIPTCKFLSENGFSVTGIDISSKMLSHARLSAPKATFIEADILSYQPSAPSSSSAQDPDAIVAYFSMIGHVTQNDIRHFFKKVHSLLAPNGIFIYASVPLEGNEILIQWMDRVFPSSSFTEEDTLLEIQAAGFEIVKHEIVKFRPNRGEESLEETQIFVYARKKQAA